MTIFHLLKVPVRERDPADPNDVPGDEHAEDVPPVEVEERQRAGREAVPA